MNRPLSMVDTNFSERLVRVADGDVSALGVFAHWIHVCKDTYLIAGDQPQIQKFVDSKECIDSTACHFPQDKWKIEYRYLGDHQVGQKIKFDLRLKESESNITYLCRTRLPQGLKYEDGHLTGTVNDETDILHLDIEAVTPLGSSQATYMIRFYQGVNKAKSFLADNYLKLGFGPNLIDYDPTQIYFRNFNGVTDLVDSPLEEAKLAAKKIHAKAAGKKIYLFISGGVDSQAMVQSFVQAAVPFQVVLMVDPNGCNKDDVHFARLFVKKMNLNLLEYTLDFVEFIRSYRYVEMAKKFRFNNPEYGVLLHLMQQFDGYGVYAGRPISISHAPTGEQVVGLAVDETWSRARFLERTGLDGCPEFLIHTPELMQSFLNTEYAKNYPLKTDWNYDSKLKLLKQGGFNIESAPPAKFTGFENLYSYFQDTEFGNEIWLHHRGPLKLRFPNPQFRNAIQIQHGQVIQNQKLITKPYEDGFSYNYLLKNPISSFH